MSKIYRDYLFIDRESGEDFLVEVDVTNLSPRDAFAEAKRIAKENFDAPSFVEEMSAEEGEMLGLDTY